MSTKNGDWNRIHSLSFSPDGKTIVSVSDDAQVEIGAAEMLEPQQLID